MPVQLQSLFGYSFAGNSVALLLASVCIGLGLWIGFHLFVGIGKQQLHRHAVKHEGAATLSHVLGRIPSWVWAAVAFSIALRLLHLPSFVDRLLYALFIITMVALGIVIAERVIERVLWRSIPRFRAGEEMPAVVRFTLNILLWALGVLLILSNLGINVISLVAGLGIGGIAVALAAQNILSDIFSSFSLYFDQPFKEGDFIVIGNHMGTVKKIGIKTTRIAALQGEEIVIPNRELTESRVQNFKRMHERRVAFRFGVTYSTPLEQMREIPVFVREVVESLPKVRFDRAHFFQFGESSLDVEVVYYVLSSEYNDYMDTQQAINLKLLDHFRSKGISFAFPTRTVEIVKGDPTTLG